MLVQTNECFCRYYNFVHAINKNLDFVIPNTLYYWEVMRWLIFIILIFK